MIPIIDLSSADAAGAVDEACRTIGFFAIRGHGVSEAVIGRMLDATTAFFALPLEEKLRYRPPSVEVNRGYAAKGSEGLVYSLGVDEAPPDLFEAFNIGADDNIWPDRPAELKPALTAYFEDVRALAHRLTSICASALGLEPDFFEDKTDHSTDTIRVNNYQRGPGDPPPLPEQRRMGAHTDYGILTVLYADAVPGLQIVGPDGEWQDVQPTEGTLLVNLGDLLAEWTNDRWRSTLHRVVDTAAHRRSVAFFHDGNDDALVECLPTCCSADNPPRYPPVRAGAHLRAKLLGPRTLSASDAVSTVGDRGIS